jgi:hypothetical protein
MSSPKVLIAFYSRSRVTEALANAVAEGAHGVGAEVRLRRAREFVSPEITPTAGHVVFVGDMGGNLYTLDADSGSKLWSSDLGGAIASGVISYDSGAGHKIAVATGMTAPIWPTGQSDCEGRDPGPPVVRAPRRSQGGTLRLPPRRAIQPEFLGNEVNKCGDCASDLSATRKSRVHTRRFVPILAEHPHKASRLNLRDAQRI